MLHVGLMRQDVAEAEP